MVREGTVARGKSIHMAMVGHAVIVARGGSLVCGMSYSGHDGGRDDSWPGGERIRRPRRWNGGSSGPQMDSFTRVQFPVSKSVPLYNHLPPVSSLSHTPISLFQRHTSTHPVQLPMRLILHLICFHKPSWNPNVWPPPSRTRRWAIKLTREHLPLLTNRPYTGSSLPVLLI